MPCLKCLSSSNIDHHHTRRAAGGDEVWLLVDFRAVHGCKLDLLLEMPRCGWGIDSSGCWLETGIQLSARPDLFLLVIPACPKTFTLGPEEVFCRWQEGRFLPLQLGEQRN